MATSGSTRIGDRRVSSMGIGSYGVGGKREPDPSNDENEIEAMKFALDNGINIIDTAEMYGGGHSEEVVSAAIKDFDRESLYVVTKVLPSHLSKSEMVGAAKASIERLKCKYIDLYLIHWLDEGSDIKSAISNMESLVDMGLVRNIGVSNFGVNDLKEAIASAKKYDIVANEIEYNLLEKECEKNVIPFCTKNKITVIAYTPMGRGKVAEIPKVKEVARRVGKTPVQVALNYISKKAIPIPKAGRLDHMKEVLGGRGWRLSAGDYKELGAL